MALSSALLAMVLLGASKPADTTTPAVKKTADTTPAAAKQNEKDKKAEVKKPADRIAVLYFHRTKRCSTCQRMGSFSEEAVKKGFAAQIKDGTIEFINVDFQDPKNGALAKGYRINGPALILVKIEDNRAVAARNLQDIWTMVADRPAFLKYVHDNVVAYQKLTVKPKTTDPRKTTPKTDLKTEPKTALKPSAPAEAATAK